MRLLVIHLSDIHIRREINKILSRAKGIALAALSTDLSIDAIVLALTGDIAFSGTEEQYLLALEVIEKISEYLRQELRDRRKQDIPLVIAAVPGNHDCNFEISTDIRQLLLEKKDHSKLIAPEVVDLLTKAQDSFFDFLESVVTNPLTRKKDNTVDRLVYRQVFSVDTETVEIICINTAWVSQLHERPGTLCFPSDRIVSNSDQSSLVIAMHHHPWNWLEPNNAKGFRQAVEKASDIILTGHEHEAFKRDQQTVTGAVNTFIEGAVLQESDDSIWSAFNTLLIDTHSRKHKFCCFKWDPQKNCYVRDPDLLPVKADEDGWEEFGTTKNRKNNRFQILGSFTEKLENPGIQLTHPSRGTLSLPDIFVYPDLREMVMRDDIIPSNIKGEHVIDFITRQPQILIAGDSQSGKTSLAKMLFRDLHSQGIVPLLISPKDSPIVGDKSISGNKIKRTLEDLFRHQYEGRDIDLFNQLPIKQKAIIIDDYDRLVANSKGRANLIDVLSQCAGHIILIADQVSVELHELLRSDFGMSTTKYYQIKPFGHVRRNRIVEKWLSLGNADGDIEQFTRQLSNITRMLDNLIGKNFVPAFPIFILSVLQASEAATPIDTSASTYGYYYELFIRISLSRGRTNNEYDIAVAYLAHLAYGFFVRRSMEINRDQLRQLHREYEALYDLDIDFEVKKKDLLSSEILAEHDGVLRFKYMWVYYYFVASYIKEHLESDEVRSHVRRLCRNIYVAEYANILLFLAHLSKDRYIISELVDAAKMIFSEYEPARFDDDVKFLPEVEKVAAETVYQFREARSNRDEIAQAMDESDGLQLRYELQDELPQDQIARNPLVCMNLALKTLQILGQIIKNFPGSLVGTSKLQMTRECYRLGLRAATSVFSLLRGAEHDYLSILVEMIAQDHPSFSLREIQDKARSFVTRVGFWTAFGVVKRIAQAVGSPELSETYNKLDKEIDTPASQLILLSIRLDQFLDSPQDQVIDAYNKLSNNHLAAWILRTLVIEHFNLFPVALRTKQAICTKLKIPIKSTQLGPLTGDQLLSTSTSKSAI